MLSAKRIVTLSALVSLTLVPVFSVYAKDSSEGTETNASTVEKQEIRPGRVEENKEERVDQRNTKVEDKIENRRGRPDIKMASREAKIGHRTEIEKDISEDLMATREAKLQQLRKDFEERRDELKVKMATREAALTAKLKLFKDKQKAGIAQRVSDNLNKVNSEKVEGMNKTLGKLSDILTKLDKIASESAAKGKDISALTSSIGNARDVINTAQQAVNIQAGKDYTVVASSEDKVKTDVESKRKLLNDDLKLTHQKVVDARKAVSDIIPIIRSATAGGSESGK